MKHSLRSFRNRRSYIIINILGLSIGLACSLMIAIFILHETSYDRYNKKRDRIYNLVLNFKIAGQEVIEAESCVPIGPTMAAEFPEVEDFLRVGKVWDAKSITCDNTIFQEENILEADSSFFNFFSIPVLKGDPGNLLNAPYKVVLTASLARKVFGDQDPLGKIIRVGKDTLVYTVSGVMDDIPTNSHFKAGVIISAVSDPRLKSVTWGNNNHNTYLLLKPNTDYKSVEEKIPPMIAKNMGPEIQRFLNISFEEFLAKGNRFGYFLQKLTDIHLDTSVRPHFSPVTNPKFLIVLGSIALMILLIAAINFTNLATAQASVRGKEVGVKKAEGSTRGMLISQFLTESIAMSLISTLFALLIIRVALPQFSSLLGTSLKLDLTGRWYMIPGLVAFAILTGIMAGTYPAFFLSSFNPVTVLKGSTGKSASRGTLRKILVVFQFTISIFLIIGTLIMYGQIMYMLKKDPGFNKDQLLIIENKQALGTRKEAFIEALRGVPGVMKLTSSTGRPGTLNSNNGYMLEGKKDETILMWTNMVDYDFTDTYEIQLVSGRKFSRDYATDADACILNEAAIKKFNIDPSKMRILGYRDSGKVFYYPIIGVVKDFMFGSQKEEVAPHILRLESKYDNWGYITAKLAAGNFHKTVEGIEAKWKEFVPNEPFKYRFADDAMKEIYTQERNYATIALISSLLAILVAALGLFGLTSYTVDLKTKEIGIRKAMGSTIPEIFRIMSSEILGLILISSLIAYPAVYYVAGNWLEGYYYRKDPGFMIYAAGLFITIGIALMTTSFRILKAARINPSESLKYE